MRFQRSSTGGSAEHIFGPVFGVFSGRRLMIWDKVDPVYKNLVGLRSTAWIPWNKKDHVDDKYTGHDQFSHSI